MRFRVFMILLLATVSSARVSEEQYKEIFLKVSRFLEVRHKNDSRLLWATKDKLHKSSSFKRSLESYMIRDQRALEDLVIKSLREYETFYKNKANVFNKFQKQVKSWFPHLYPLLASFSQYLWGKGLQTDEVQSLTASKDQFELRISDHLRKFQQKSEINKELLENITSNYIRDILRKDFKNLNQSTFKTMKKVAKLYEINLLFNRNKMRQLIEENLTNEQTHSRNNHSFKQLETLLNTWFDLTTINQRVVIILKSKNISQSDLNELSSSKINFLEKAEEHLENLSKKQKEDFENLLKRETMKVLSRPDLKLANCSMTNDLKARLIAKKVSLITFYKPTEWHRLIINECLVETFETCLRRINEEINKMFSESENSELIKAKRHFFLTNKCAPKEICSVKTDGDSAYLREQLSPYFVAYERKVQHEETSGNLNIKDEFDVTIYETIQEFLKSGKKYSDEKVECIINNMIRTKSVDAIYTSEMLFEDSLLRNSIEPLVKQYERIYNKMFLV